MAAAVRVLREGTLRERDFGCFNRYDPSKKAARLSSCQGRADPHQGGSLAAVRWVRKVREESSRRSGRRPVLRITSTASPALWEEAWNRLTSTPGCLVFCIH